MFIKESIFKKMAKQAWKNNMLVIIHADGVYHIELKWITLQVKREFMSNKIKASLIELIGELPAEGEGYKYGESSEPQQRLGLFEHIDAVSGDECNPTCVLINNNGNIYNVLQTKDSKIMVNNGFMSLIDTSQINEAAGEYEPGKPCLSDNHLTWINNVMALKVPVTLMRYRTDKIILSLDEDLIFDGELID